MYKIGKVFYLTLIIAVCCFYSVFAQTSPPQLQIENPEIDTIPYCNDPVLVAPEIIIRNVDMDEATEGMKISIANFKQGEDTLFFEENSKFTPEWDNVYGYLEIKGPGSSAEYQSAVRNVYYKNLAIVPDLEPRSISISLLDADYLPYTEHFYRFVKKTDISWTEAKAMADTMSYYGLQGYLATITSSIENNFIWTKIDGVGWIGGSDEESEGNWKWMTGPEVGTQFWQGGIDGRRVNGMYANWSEGEPNNQGDEDYAHINQNPGKAQKTWNDLPDAGDGPSSDYYRAQGFIVEFGEMLDDPVLNLSATSVIKINKIAFSEEREFEICAGDAQKLNFSAPDIYSYTWTPKENISSVIVSEPIVTPTQTTTYKLTGKLGTCESSANFFVKVNPLPVHQWDSLYVICDEASIELNPGSYASYQWDNMDSTQTISVLDEGWHSVILTSDFGCVKKDSTLVKRSVAPILDYENIDTLVCGAMQQTLNLAFNDSVLSTLLIPLQANSIISNDSLFSPTVTVDKYGVYYFEVEVENQYQCTDTLPLKLEFHNQPDVDFDLDEKECKGYSLDLNFIGLKVETAIFSWYANDTVYKSEENLTEIMIPLGYGERSRTVGLKVNEQGCLDSLTKDVTVIPAMEFGVAENTEGCTPLNVRFYNKDAEDIESYHWDFGDGGTALVKNPIHKYLNSNLGVDDISFDVQLTVESVEGCENTGIIKDAVLVHPIPTVDLSFKEDSCYSEEGSVSYIGSATTSDAFYWDLSGFQDNEFVTKPGNSAGPFEFKRTSAPTVNIGIQVVSEFGCRTDSISKIFSRKPIFDIDPENQKGCPPLDVEFTASSIDLVDDVDYSWALGGEISKVGATISNKFIQEDKKYDVEIIAKSNITGCSDTTLLPEGIYVYPQPKAVFSANPSVVVISNPLVNFENRSENADFYEWNFEDSTAFSDEINPQHYFSGMGYFDVRLVAQNGFGCVDTTSQEVIVAFDKVFPPTAFSPNATLEEDREFRIYSKGIANDGYNLQVYNRWGEVVFESLNQKFGWDGKMKNDNYAPAGVYTWVIQYLDFRGKKYKQQGTVTLLF